MCSSPNAVTKRSVEQTDHDTLPRVHGGHGLSNFHKYFDYLPFLLLLLMILLFFTFIPLSRYNMFSSCCNKDSAIVFTTDRLPDVNPL
jgi:hypothetical protein